MKNTISSFPIFSSVATLLALALAVNGCSSDSANDPASGDDLAQARNYNGPGSKWDVNMETDGSFTITHRVDASSPVDMTVNGEYEALSSGFTHFVVDNASGTDAPSPGDEAWGLEIEGYAMMLKPVDATSNQIIPMINSGTCPNADFSANWVLVRKGSSSDASGNDRDFFGEFDFELATNRASLPDRFALDNNFTSQGAGTIDNPAGGSCADGLMLVSDAEMYLTGSGGAIVHTNLTNPAESSFIFALAQNPITDITNLDANYAGMLFDESSATGDRIQPVSVSCSAGTCSGSIVTDIVANTLSAEMVTMSLSGGVDDLANGLITGTISGSGGSGNLACMADVNVSGNGGKIVSCVGQSPSDNTQMFNIILMSQN
ncbi:MAG: hypothetical protein GY806_17905 [Gammaproteobacteria bacterium]|nr:hypothetical protein [Gammaproteobacteria bacterium]